MNFKTVNILALILLASIFIFLELNWSLLYYIVPLIIVYCSLIAWGSYAIRLNFFFKSINKNKKGLCITFDDGPHPERTPQILDILKKHNVKATFFLIGNRVHGNEHILQRIVKEGHVIGNHTYSHSNKTALFSTDKVSEEIKKTNQVIYQACGVKPIIFRPPFGVTNPRIGKAIKENLMHSIGWDIRSYDTMAKTTDELVRRIEKGIDKNGSILLLHDDREMTVKSLDAILTLLRSKNIALADKVTG